MSFYRTSDIKKRVDDLARESKYAELEAVLRDPPRTSNYLIENSIESGKIQGQVIEVYASATSSTTPLYRHLELPNLDNSCYIQLTEQQEELIVKDANVRRYKSLGRA